MRALTIGLLLAVLVACGLPRDPDGTLDRVRGGIVRAGFVESPPWASGAAADPRGVEIDLVHGFAEQLGATVEWTTASEAEVFQALEAGVLDLVVGGLDAADPWVATAGMTRPYTTTRLTIGVPEGTDAAIELEGRSVAVQRGSEAEGLVEQAGATPAPVDTLRDVDGPAAVEDWLLDDLGLVSTGRHLAETEHVMAVPLGENAWLVALERYLHERAAQIRAAVDAAGTVAP